MIGNTKGNAMRARTLLILTASGLALTLGACSGEEGEGAKEAEKTAEKAQDTAQDHAGEAKDDHAGGGDDHGGDDGAGG